VVILPLKASRKREPDLFTPAQSGRLPYRETGVWGGVAHPGV